jgi:hypothetical protein
MKQVLYWEFTKIRRLQCIMMSRRPGARDLCTPGIGVQVFTAGSLLGNDNLQCRTLIPTFRRNILPTSSASIWNQFLQTLRCRDHVPPKHPYQASKLYGAKTQNNAFGMYCVDLRPNMFRPFDHLRAPTYKEWNLRIFSIFYLKISSKFNFLVTFREKLHFKKYI